MSHRGRDLLQVGHPVSAFGPGGRSRCPYQRFRPGALGSAVHRFGLRARRVFSLPMFARLTWRDTGKPSRLIKYHHPGRCELEPGPGRVHLETNHSYPLRSHFGSSHFSLRPCKGCIPKYWRVSQVAAMKRQASVLGARRLGRAKGAVVRNPWRLTTSFGPPGQAGARRALRGT